MDSKKKILIIEDSKTTVRILREILLENDYDVDFFYDGIGGYARIENWKPDLVILDLIMPGMDGLSCLHRIKSNPKTSTIPVIILTAKGTMRDVFEHKEIAAFIEKPFESDQLLRVVRSALVSSP
jgi:DNA-binding response OmpR family regulator